ncbi:MAG: PilZ domain-containing protein [Acidobacteriia bacterium]|nr:PilZ domain-containing protein [Terriglobia bacterium]
MDEAFCPVCCTQHGNPVDCPGELRATGPERHGWAMAVDAPRGVDLCGVIVAPSETRWRARIVTYPLAPWRTPGCSGVLKFVGSTEEEAQAKALDFIRRWCSERNRAPHDGFGRWERREGAIAGRPPPRRRRSHSIRYRVGGISTLTTTANLSPEGMFLTAPEPPAVDTPLELEIEIFGCIATLRGVVVWRRDRLQPGRPRGMGVRLLDPPPVYKMFVQGLK